MLGNIFVLRSWGVRLSSLLSTTSSMLQRMKIPRAQKNQTRMNNEPGKPIKSRKKLHLLLSSYQSSLTSGSTRSPSSPVTILGTS